MPFMYLRYGKNVRVFVVLKISNCVTCFIYVIRGHDYNKEKFGLKNGTCKFQASILS